MTINKSGSVLLLTLFFSYSLLAAPLKIGIIDTGFCGNQFEEVFNATREDLGNLCALKKNHPRLHGQLVLEELLINAPKNLKLYPIIVFNKKGEQKLSYWEAALKYAEIKNLDYLLIAAGYPTIKKVKFPLIKIPSFISSGTTQRGIKKKTYLYPQEMVKNKMHFLIGSYSPSRDIKINDAMVDSRRMYPSKIDYYFSGDREKTYLNGSSKAAATALGRALKLCKNKELRPCLKNLKKEIVVINNKEALPSF